MDVLPILVLLSPPHNSILIPMHLCLNKLFMEEEQSLESYNFFGWCLFFNQVKTVQIFLFKFFLTALCLHISIFSQGNSNGLATIDISPAYTGLTDFHPVIVGTLLAVSTYSGLILWLLLFLKDISRKKLSLSDTEFIPFLFSRGIEHCFYLIVMTVQRHHLFIWSVFSPKFLYLGMAVLVTNIFLSIFCIICDINVFKNE